MDAGIDSAVVSAAFVLPGLKIAASIFMVEFYKRFNYDSYIEENVK